MYGNLSRIHKGDKMIAPANIQPYNTKATDIFEFLGTPSNEAAGFEKLYFGIELELTARDKWLEEKFGRGSTQLWEHIYPYCKNFAIAAHDGSIKTAGFELKSAPMLYNTAKQNFGSLFEFIEANKEAFTAYGDNCGIHIHISRNALSDMHLSRFNMFINAPKNRDFIQLIAERQSNIYCQYNDLVNEESYRSQNRHYDSVNVSANTVEIRIFKGTCLVDSFMKNLEFIHAVLRYTNPELMNDYRSIADFKAFVADNKVEYPHLNTFIEESEEAKQCRVRLLESIGVKTEVVKDAETLEREREERVAKRLAAKYGSLR
jgi:hypothetical protein